LWDSEGGSWWCLRGGGNWTVWTQSWECRGPRSRLSRPHLHVLFQDYWIHMWSWPGSNPGPPRPSAEAPGRSRPSWNRRCSEDESEGGWMDEGGKKRLRTQFLVDWIQMSSCHGPTSGVSRPPLDGRGGSGQRWSSSRRSPSPARSRPPLNRRCRRRWWRGGPRCRGASWRGTPWQT
jgi:hypothetical protein